MKWLDEIFGPWRGLIVTFKQMFRPKVTTRYPDEKRAVHIDAEWIYRNLAPWLVRTTGGVVARADAYIRSSVLEFVGSVLRASDRAHGQLGPLARSWPTGSMVLWVAILLGAYLIFYL